MTSVTLPGTRALVDRARERGAVPRVHPNGFIQLDLADDGTRVAPARLHVWPDRTDIPRQSVVTTIHDHKFNMRSSVVKGRLVQLRYPVSVAPSHSRSGFMPGWRFTHEVHVATEHPDPERAKNRETILGPTGVFVHVGIPSTEIVEAGRSYAQPRYTFHDTAWHGLTATIMEKGKEDSSYNPRVLVPIGHEPDNSFVRAHVDLDLCWNYIERAVA
jgi:hypothetical protein